MASNNEGGVWRTIGGRRVFIKDGQSLADAMIESGKFKNDARSAYRKAKEEAEKASKKQEIIEKLDKDTEDLTEYDKYNLAVSKLEQLENMQPEEKKYWENVKDKYTSKEKVKEQKDHTFEMNEEEKKKYEEVGKKIDNLTKEIEDSKIEKEKKDTFTQTSTNPFYPDREYNKEQLNKMEENKIKPMKNSYSGSGWEGTNYDSNLSTKDIAKNINEYSKKEFPDVKLSRKTDYNSIDMNIMSSGKNMLINEKDIDNFTGSQAIDVVKSSVGGIGRMDDYFIKNKEGYTTNRTYNDNDVKEYLKYELKNMGNMSGRKVSGDEWYLNEYGKKVITGLNREMNSYNFDDDDPMTDYFHSNFYGNVYLGRWDKPYQASENDLSRNQIESSLQQKAYKKYLKEHPNSKMTFNEFKKEQD